MSVDAQRKDFYLLDFIFILTNVEAHLACNKIPLFEVDIYLSLHTFVQYLHDWDFMLELRTLL